ncbi:MAG: hypothetical protein WBC92_14050, partial [Terracidiphilus sp.]
MQSFDANETSPARRKLLGGLAAATSVSAAALLGMNPTTAAAAPVAAGAQESEIPEEILALARLRNYRNRRSSSWDRTGGNADWAVVDPGQSATVLDVQGAGVVTHIWFTINSPDSMHLKNLV